MLLNWLVRANCFKRRKKHRKNSCSNTKVLLFFVFFCELQREKGKVYERVL